MRYVFHAEIRCAEEDKESAAQCLLLEVRLPVALSHIDAMLALAEEEEEEEDHHDDHTLTGCARVTRALFARLLRLSSQQQPQHHHPEETESDYDYDHHDHHDCDDDCDDDEASSS